jgi:hypothetical protein
VVALEVSQPLMSPLKALAPLNIEPYVMYKTTKLISECHGISTNQMYRSLQFIHDKIVIIMDHVIDLQSHLH